MRTRLLRQLLDQPNVAFDRLDHRVQVPVQHLFGQAQGEALGRVEGNMRRQRQRKGIDHRIHARRDRPCAPAPRRVLPLRRRVLRCGCPSRPSLRRPREIRVLEIDAKRDHAGLLLLDVDEVERFVVEDDLNHRRLALHCVSRSPSPSIVNPPSPHRAMVCRPGYASCAPNALGAALAMDAQENEPKSLRFVPPLMCLAGQMHAVPVSTKNMASSARKIAERRGQKFRTDGLDPRSFLDIVLQKLVERARLRDVFVEKRLSVFSWTFGSSAVTVALMSPTSPRSTAVRRPMCFGFLSIWTFFTSSPGRNSENGKSVPSSSSRSAS